MSLLCHSPIHQPSRGALVPRVSLQCCWWVQGRARPVQGPKTNGDKAPVQGTVVGVVQGTVPGLTR